MQLRELGVNLEQEDNAAGFLGVTLEWDPETGLHEANWTDQMSYQSTWIGRWTSQRKVHPIRIQTIGQEYQR